jgi:hypothetical protein
MERINLIFARIRCALGALCVLVRDNLALNVDRMAEGGHFGRVQKGFCRLAHYLPHYKCKRKVRVQATH